MDAALIALDLLLVAGLALRLTRFFTSDYLGDWWVVEPVQRWAARQDLRRGNGETVERYVTKLFECPFCIGFWLGTASLLSLALAGGPGEAADWWRWVAAIFAANYVLGHINARLDG